MLKETETKETVSFFVTFLSLVVFQLWEPGPLASPPWLRLLMKSAYVLLYTQDMSFLYYYAIITS